MALPKRHARATAGAALLVLASCGSDQVPTGPVPPPEPAALTAVAGNDQAAPAGTPLAQDVVVHVTDAAGAGVPGAAVFWRVVDGDGSAAAVQSITDVYGYASVGWTLGTAAGAPQRLEATVATVETPVMFTARSIAGPPAGLAIVSGDAQTGIAGEQVGAPLTVRVADAFDNSTTGVTVIWTAMNGSGTTSAPASVTDSTGHARVGWTLGTTAGTGHRAAAALAELPGTLAVFSATAVAGPAARFVIVSGDDQHGTVGQLLSAPLIVLLRDAHENPVADVTVAWTVSAGGGSVSNSTAMTDSQGRAAATWTLGATAGSGNHVVQAVAEALAGSPLTFRASADPGTAAQLTASSGDGQSGIIGQPLPDPLVVTLRDAFGNPVPAVTVNWTVTAGGGGVSALGTGTDAQGRAAVNWTLGMVAGNESHAVQAYVNDLSGSPVTFRASAGTATPSTLSAVSGNGQTGPVGQPLGAPLVVLVRDAFDNPVPDVAVTWTVTAGGGSVSVTSPSTDATGRASAVWTLGNIVGTDAHAAQASVSGLGGSPILFTATGAAGPSVATTLVLVSGNDQTGQVGMELSVPLVVQVLDDLGNPVAGTAVQWSVTAGGGSVSATANSTDAQGLASVTWTLGPNAGTDNNGAAAAVAGLAGSPVAFVASGVEVPAPTTTLTLVSGDGQSGIVAQPLTDPVVVEALNEVGAPVSGVNVAWTVTAGDGSLSASSVTTDANGRAQVSWILGTAAGAGHALEATLPGSSTVSVGATALADLPSAMTLVSGDAQTGVAGQALPTPFAVAVLDQFGNPTAGVAVTWSATAGAGAVSAASTDTDVSGQASVIWTLGTVAGTGNNAARAAVTGLQGSPIDIQASALPGPPDQISILDGDQQTGPAGALLPVPYVVRVSDAFDNPIPDVTVSWSVGAGGGSLSSPATVSDPGGVASAQRTLGTASGTQTTTASIAGIVATFTATATPNAMISGTIVLAEAFLAPPAAVVSDAVAVNLTRPFRTKSVPVRQGRSDLWDRGDRGAARPRFAPGELIVTFRPEAIAAPAVGSRALGDPAVARIITERIREEIVESLDPATIDVRGVSPAIHAARVRVANPDRLDEAAAQLRAHPAVAEVHRNALVYSNGVRRAAPAMATTPAEPLYPVQSWHFNMIDLPAAWDITTGSAAVLVAIIDDGVRFDHPAVAANLTSDGYDFASDLAINSCFGGTVGNAGDGDGYDSDPTQPDQLIINGALACVAGSMPSGNHGLHIAGTIGAVGNDGIGVSGVNWNVSIRPIRVLGVAGVGTAYDAAQGVLYAAGLPADDGAGGVVQVGTAARVINMSLGGPSPSVELENALIAATGAGALIVASAGNTASTEPSYPAAYPQTLTVSAVGPDGLLASYSSFGPSVDLAAPGGDLVDGDATYGVMSTAWNFVTGTPIYDNAIWDGTSMAAAHVSGVAALLLAQDAGLTVAELRARLTDYAVDLGDAGPDDLYGAGLVNARNSLTQSLSPPSQLYARLYDALSGAVLETTPVLPDGTYTFSDLADGYYHIYAGLDEDGDQQIGVPGRRWGAFGGSASPVRVPITNGAGNTASFTVGLPSELEPNGDVPEANVLPIGGYLYGTIDLADFDVVSVEIPATGTYTFETSGWIGACGFALEEDTILTLYDALGNIITTNDDIDFDNLNVCSRITATLDAGTYFLGIDGYYTGQYRIGARRD